MYSKKYSKCFRSILIIIMHTILPSMGATTIELETILLNYSILNLLISLHLLTHVHIYKHIRLLSSCPFYPCDFIVLLFSVKHLKTPFSLYPDVYSSDIAIIDWFLLLRLFLRYSQLTEGSSEQLELVT